MDQSQYDTYSRQNLLCIYCQKGGLNPLITEEMLQGSN